MSTISPTPPLPEDFSLQMQRLLGKDYPSFEKSLRTPSPTSIRLNPFKQVERPEGETVPWSPEALYLSTRPEFVFDPLWHAGAYYVQEAGSMFAGHALKQLMPKLDRPIVLDLCAAPGGKSTHLASILNGSGLLISNEIIKGRLHILQENLTKWGLPNTVISHNDSSQFSKMDNFFDVVVVDAPCSGEGLFRKQPDAMNEWTSDQVLFCANRQNEILENIWSALKPGGYLIYSTCTYNEEENEIIIERWCEEQNAKPIEIQINSSWGITSGKNGYGYRFYPHLAQSEGFYLCVIQKEVEQYSNRTQFVKKPYFSWPSLEEKQHVHDHFFTDKMIIKKQSNGILNLLPEFFYPQIEFLANRLHVIQAGTEVVEVKGKDFNPTQASANSILTRKDTFVEIPLEKQNAVSYLSKQDISYEGPIGHHLLTYKGTGIGWTKKMGNRTNNYYPAEWKIRQKQK